MVSFVDVKMGMVTLADLVGITHYLDMKADIEYATMQKQMKKGQRHGRS